MKSSLAAILVGFFAPLSSCAEVLQPGFYSAFDGSKKATQVWEIEREADHSIRYHMDSTLGIGIGEVRDGVHYAKSFSLAELGHYFQHCKHKNFVSLTFDKAAPEKKTIDEAIKELEEFFFSRGFERVLFLGARGSGVMVHKDSINSKVNKSE